MRRRSSGSLGVAARTQPTRRHCGPADRRPAHSRAGDTRPSHAPDPPRPPRRRLLRRQRCGRGCRWPSPPTSPRPCRRSPRGFEQATGHKAVLALGSTGKFYAQIRNGAPFEVLLGRGPETPARLEGGRPRGARAPASPTPPAGWCSGAPSRRRSTRRAQVLRQPRARQAGHRRPARRPLRRGGGEVLSAWACCAAWQPRLVQGESIGQAFQFAATGNARAGLRGAVAGDGRRPHRRGSAWIVPAHLHAPLRQDAVLLQRRQGQPAPPPPCWTTCAATRRAPSSALYGYEL